MTIVAAYDGTALSERGLDVAASMGKLRDQEVVAVSIVPDNEDYAREKGWIDEGEAFDAATVLGRLDRRVEAIAPDARFEYERVGRFAPPGEIAGEIRRIARAQDASLVVVGSADAGRIAAPVTSVGGTVSSTPAYDIYIVRPRDEDPVESPADESGAGNAPSK